MSEPPPLPSPARIQELFLDAARIGRDDVIPALLQAGAAIEGKDARGFSALMLAAYNGHEATVRLLAGHGAAVDGIGDVRGNPPLIGVAFKGHEAVAQTLLAAGADVNLANAAGQTALMTAALFRQDAIIALLLAHGADAAPVDAAGNTAASLARAQGNDVLAERLGG